MLSNRPVADELADVRAEIRALKTREQRLRQKLLKEPEARCGWTHEVIIQKQRRKVFCRERLPAHITDDPALWDVRQATQVTVRRRVAASAVRGLSDQRAPWPEMPGDAHKEPTSLRRVPDEYDVLEPF